MTAPAPAAWAVEARGLVKRFGARRALDGVDLRLARGEALAVFGPNGAGKTTLIRLLTLALAPTSGSLRVHGLDPRREPLAIRAAIGVISHHTFLYDDLSARQNLEFWGALHGVARPAERAAELLALVGLSARADDAVRGFSRGMQQRLAFARALVHDPPLLFLDEPFSGLDPHAAETLRRTLDALRAERRTLLLVTHHLSQGLELSDRWLILDRGRIVGTGASRGTAPGDFEPAYFARLDGGAG